MSRFCSNCGKEMKENSDVCLECGVSCLNNDFAKDSYFDGGLLQLIGWLIVGFFITIFTLGICFPWACCLLYNWEISHTVINGKRLGFNGKAIQLFGTWMKWLLFTILTFGIYSFWINISLKKWKAKHTFFIQ